MISNEVNSRATIVEGGFTARAVVDGRAVIAIEQLSELRFIPRSRLSAPPQIRSALHRVRDSTRHHAVAGRNDTALMA